MFTIVLPNLIHPQAELDTPTLNQWLRFGLITQQACNTSKLYANYLGLPQLPKHSALAIPAWQEIGIQSSQLVDSRQLDIDLSEATHLITELNQFYAGEITFDLLHAKIWQVNFKQTIDWQIPSIFDTCGQTENMLHYANAYHQEWLKLSTEIQMFLHHHPLNQQRQHKQQPPINHLWLWQPENTSATVQAALLGSNSPWAQIDSPNHIAAPTDFSAWIDSCKQHQIALDNTLLFSEDFININPDQYNHTVNYWENHFFAPIEKQLKNKQLKHLQIICEQGSLIIDTQRWAFWKQKKTFDGKHWK